MGEKKTVKAGEARKCLEYLGYEAENATRVTKVRLPSRKHSGILIVVLGALVVLGVVYIVARSEMRRTVEPVAQTSQTISEDASNVGDFGTSEDPSVPGYSLPSECFGFWLPVVRGLLARSGG